jgi:hypothetical protein
LLAGKTLLLTFVVAGLQSGLLPPTISRGLRDETVKRIDPFVGEVVTHQTFLAETSQMSETTMMPS